MKKAGLIMIIGTLLLSGLFVFPLWQIMLGAPQYPEPLGINIHLDGLQDVNEFDIQNIDGLNHYIGMKTLPKPEDMWEFDVFPKVILGMIALGVLFGLFGYLKKLSANWFLGWFILMSVLGIMGMYDFNLWLLDYGTDLDPHAIIKLKDAAGNLITYKPPLFGHQKLLNFDVTSLPHIGGYLMFAGMSLVLYAFYLGKKAK
jgi:hypothetical protein